MSTMGNTDDFLATLYKLNDEQLNFIEEMVDDATFLKAFIQLHRKHATSALRELLEQRHELQECCKELQAAIDALSASELQRRAEHYEELLGLRETALQSASEAEFTSGNPDEAEKQRGMARREIEDHFHFLASEAPSPAYLATFMEQKARIEEQIRKFTLRNLND